MSCFPKEKILIRFIDTLFFIFSLYETSGGLYDRWASQHIGIEGVSSTGTLTLDTKWMDD